MDHLQAMRIFVKVVAHGSFIRTAEQLGTSAAVVTRHIGDMESHLGTRLLNRTTRKLSLTEAGEKYLARATQILQDVDEADADAMSHSKQPTGTLHIYSHQSFGESQLAHLLHLFRKSYPDIAFDVTLTDRTVDLVDEGFDVGFFLSVQKFEASMIARQLGVSEVILCTSPEYIQRHGAPACPEDLLHHTCLNFSHELLRHWSIEGPQGVMDIPIKSNMVSNNSELLRQSAALGMGIVIRPSFMLHDDLTTGRVVRLLPDHQLGSGVGVYMVYPSPRFLPAKVSSFVEFISKQFPRPEADPWSTIGNTSSKRIARSGKRKN
jgi:DNA-binding transcriptional LysR family regulator